MLRLRDLGGRNALLRLSDLGGRNALLRLRDLGGRNALLRLSDFGGRNALLRLSNCWNGIKNSLRTLPLLSQNKSQTCARSQVLRKKIQHAMQTTD